MEGNEYVQQKENRIENYSTLTISAWVKPNYDKGSSKFTILAKPTAFDLSINKDIPTQKRATFSIYDGIRWDVVESKNPIPEGWTHLVGMFNGSAINIYVNGKLESSQPYVESPTILVFKALTKTTNFVSSNDITIGASADNERTSERDYFSGYVQNIDLYDRALKPTEIAQLYNNFVANSPHS